MAKQAKQPSQSTQKRKGETQRNQKSQSHKKQTQARDNASSRQRIQGAAALYVSRQMQSLFSSSPAVQSYVGHFRQARSSKW